MSYYDVAIEIRGDQLLMNRFRGEQPSEEKPPRGRMTQAHIDAKHKKKWLNAAYFDNGMFHLPPEVIEAALAEAAKYTRKGKDFKRGLMVLENFIPLIQYKDRADKKGSHLKGNTAEDYYTPEHIDVRGVRIGTARVDACRPLFRYWGLKFAVRHDDELVSVRDIESALKNMCIGDFRPRFGRVKEFVVGKPIAVTKAP